MSYDFAVLLPEIVGPDDADALTAAIAVWTATTRDAEVRPIRATIEDSFMALMGRPADGGGAAA